LISFHSTHSSSANLTGKISSSKTKGLALKQAKLSSEATVFPDCFTPKKSISPQNSFYRLSAETLHVVKNRHAKMTRKLEVRGHFYRQFYKAAKV